MRQLPRHQLTPLANELRQFLLESVSKTGGHLSSNLGTVELTIALHYVFETPHDRIVWDVGHQTYSHKILTGRRERMNTLRQLDGLSGFPQRDESEYDTFGTAHSSTSISAALGMAAAAKLKGEHRHAIAVIGDGSMTAGMAFEALNNAGVEEDCNLLVVLNDNDMSISPPVGALNRYLARLMSGQFYAAAKSVGKTVLPAPLRELASRLEEHAKGMVVPATMFEEFGFNYIGPIDGHDLDSLIPTLENIKKLKGPQFLHVVTKKGQGYKLAEAEPILYHGTGKFDPPEGIIPATAPSKITYTEVFGNWLCDMAAVDGRLVGITPAMREGSGMVSFHQRYPERYFDVGIAEQHSVTFAAGLATEGMKPVVAIYSTFLQRALRPADPRRGPAKPGRDLCAGPRRPGRRRRRHPRRQLRPRLPALHPEHGRHGRLRRKRVPPDADHRLPLSGPAAVRYPRGAGIGAAIQTELTSIEIGKGEIRRHGEKHRDPGLRLDGGAEPGRGE